MNKPEPIRVGVEGIAPAPKPARAERIDWPHLISLPPFQMFAIEHARKSPADVMAWLPAWVRSFDDDRALLEDYCQWHARKGYWPNESPMGDAVGAY